MATQLAAPSSGSDMESVLFVGFKGDIVFSFLRVLGLFIKDLRFANWLCIVIEKLRGFI